MEFRLETTWPTWLPSKSFWMCNQFTVASFFCSSIQSQSIKLAKMLVKGWRCQQTQAALQQVYIKVFHFLINIDCFCTWNIGGDPSLVNNDSTAIRKGVLWQQRDKVFSRWKERFFLLTQDYIQAFKKSTNQMSEMGRFLFKIKLSEVIMYLS